MDRIGRRRVCRVALSAAALSALAPVRSLRAAPLAGVSDSEATAGLREALDRGAAAAVAKLGVADGFLGNPKVRIPLPGFLEDVAGVARVLGMRKQLDELTVAMNRAAEAAVPKAKEMLRSAVRSMTVGDARKILTGGETSVTEFFESRTRKPLFEQFLPVVRDTTSRVGLAQRYNELMRKLPVKGGDARIEDYVTDKALDGLFYMIGQEEISIRRDPVRYGSDVLRKVFGAL